MCNADLRVLAVRRNVVGRVVLLWPEVLFNAEPTTVQSWVKVVTKVVSVVFVGDDVLRARLVTRCIAAYHVRDICILWGDEMVRIAVPKCRRRGGLSPIHVGVVRVVRHYNRLHTTPRLHAQTIDDFRG